MDFRRDIGGLLIEQQRRRFEDALDHFEENRTVDRVRGQRDFEQNDFAVRGEIRAHFEFGKQFIRDAQRLIDEQDFDRHVARTKTCCSR